MVGENHTVFPHHLPHSVTHSANSVDSAAWIDFDAKMGGDSRLRDRKFYMGLRGKLFYRRFWYERSPLRTMRIFAVC